MTLIDTHCHLNFESYDEDRDAVVARALEAGVTTVIIPAIDLDSCQAVIDLSRQYPGVYAAVGIHPTSTADFTLDKIDRLAQLAAAAKIVAVGEIGLDYYWDDSPPALQRQAFEAQLELAARLALPVIIHNRDAGDDVMDMLEAWVAGGLPESLKDRPGVLHSFSAPAEIAERALGAGFCLGFTGPITFKNADELRRVASSVPLDRILVETDGPFLTPTPYRGRRNEPAYVPYIVERLAALHQVTPQAMAEATTANAIRLFSLPI